MSNFNRTDIVNGEFIRVRFPNSMKNWLYNEKERTGESVSEIVRAAVDKEIRYRRGGLKKLKK